MKFALWPFHKEYEWIKCPDGFPKMVYKNVDYALPLLVKELQSDVNGEISAKDVLNANIKSEYKEFVKGLLFNFDITNKNIMMDYRAAYVAFQSDPCNKADYLSRRFEELSNHQQRLNSVHVLIQNFIELVKTNPANPDVVYEAFRNIASQLSGKTLPEEAALAIQESKKDAKKWIGGNIEE